MVLVFYKVFYKLQIFLGELLQYCLCLVLACHFYFYWYILKK